MSRPAVSQHLKVLKAAGLVVDEAVGTRRIYRLDPDGVAGLQAYFQGFWTQALAAFKERVEDGASGVVGGVRDERSRPRSE